MTTETHLLYGTPPRELAEIPTGATQCSPLIPGSLALEEIAPQSAASCMIYAPPGTLERRYTLALALRALAVGSPLTALAPKDKGGSRIAAELEAFGCAVAEDSRAHHRIVTTTRPEILALEEAIAAGGLRHYPNTGFYTQPGVFSWDRIDKGSALLMQHLPALTGAGADIGCGIGVLSKAVLQSAAVTSLTCIDIDRRAVQAARKNIDDARAQFLWADVRHASLSPLDFVVMNPPFHDAGIEDKALGLALITRASDLLKPAGTLWCVANRHLPYEAKLAARFTKTETLAEANGYKIIRAEK